MQSRYTFVIYLAIITGFYFFREIREFVLVRSMRKLELNSTYKSGGLFMKKTGNYGIALLTVFSAVVKADGKVYNAEIDFVRGFLFNRFKLNKVSARKLTQYHIHEGAEDSTIINGMSLFDEIFHKSTRVDYACKWISSHIPLPERKELVWFLFRISKVNRTIDAREQQLIEQLATQMGLLQSDFNHIKAEFIKEKKQSFYNSYVKNYSELDKAYNLLGVTSSNTSKEIKLAFRKLARQFHPDRYAQDSPEKIEWAEGKFSEISASYDIICARRGIK